MPINLACSQSVVGQYVLKGIWSIFSYLSRQRYSSNYPESNSAELPLTALSFLSTCFWTKWWYRSKHPSFWEKANTWVGGRNDFRNFLRKHISKIFTENKKIEKGTTFNVKSVFPPRLLHLYRKQIPPNEEVDIVIQPRLLLKINGSWHLQLKILIIEQKSRVNFQIYLWYITSFYFSK